MTVLLQSSFLKNAKSQSFYFLLSENTKFSSNIKTLFNLIKQKTCHE
jgi:hypothetical protein